MNAQIVADLIKNNNDFETIAESLDITVDELKAAIIESIKLNPDAFIATESIIEPLIESISDDEYDTDTEEEYYDRIIRKSSIPLSEEQKIFLDLVVLQRKNVLLAAQAGFGKSSVISTAIELFGHTLKPHTNRWFEKQYGKFTNVEDLRLCPTYGLCASTGKASSLIGGRTLHSYLGIGIGKGSVEEWVKRVSTARYLRDTYNNLRAVQVIIIDEVSMISAQMLDKISEYLQILRKCDKPFGGVQLIFIGDMAQLGPVGNGSTFMFNSSEYKAANVQTHILTKCFRQNDPTFIKILNEIRLGDCSDESFKILKSQTSIDEKYSQGLKPMRIVSTNAEVDRINERELMDVCNESNLTPISFPVIRVSSDTKKSEAYRKADAIPEDVKLVVGAQIVITHNISKRVVNGSQGKVVSIRSDEITVSLIDIGEVNIGYIGYKDPEHNDIYTADTLFQYMPLKLAWASTIHKCQGMTLKLIEVDLKKVFCHGQAYVALSRVRSLEGLIVKGLTSKKTFICDSAVKRFIDVE